MKQSYIQRRGGVNHHCVLISGVGTGGHGSRDFEYEYEHEYEFWNFFGIWCLGFGIYLLRYL